MPKKGGDVPTFETKADELALGQREISVAEFFTKNRHLLGFDNARKALLTTVKEAVDNSLTYDMPLLVKERGKVTLKKIGDLLDSRIGTSADKCVARNGCLEKVTVNDMEVLAFDKNLKLVFRKASTLFRHRVNSDVYRMSLEGGRSIELTSYHSVFALIKGRVESVRTDHLKQGDMIIVPRKAWGVEKAPGKIYLIEELLKLPKEMTENICIYNISFVLEEFKPRILSLLKKSYQFHDFKKCDYLPLNILRRLPVDPEKLRFSKIGFSQCRHKVSAEIEVNSNLAYLVGLYLAEGSVLHSLYKVCFSFGSTEKGLVRFTAYLVEQVFGVKASIKKAHKTAVNVTVNSSIIGFIFKHIFSLGEGAATKRVSPLIFDMGREQRSQVLLAYLAGDGYPTEEIFDVLKRGGGLQDVDVEKITCVTRSYDLFIGLQYLLSSLAFNYSIGKHAAQKRKINGVMAHFGESYALYIYTRQKISPINKVLIDATIRGIRDCKLKYAYKNQQNTKIYIDTLFQNSGQNLLYEGMDLFLQGDLGTLTVKRIEKIEYDHEWVYDLSVPGCENFMAGLGPIMCHNSLDAAEEMRVLPEVKVSITPLSESRFTIVVEDNGPGIVKEQIPRIFAKLLYGSKFHKLKCSRGQQGIGISAAGLYGQLTTGKPIRIISKTGPKKPAYYVELHIDTKRNEPELLKEEIRDWQKDHGTRVEIELEGAYQKGKQGVDEYLKETAIVNPHLHIFYTSPEGQKIEYPRATTQLPKEPKEIKPHPYGVELGILINMLKETKASTLQGFLASDFSRVSPKVAKEVCLKAGLYERAKPSRIAREEADNLIKALRETKIMAPPTDCLVPISEELILKGLKKEINAEFYAAVTRPPAVYRGNPFQIECGIAYGGDIQGDELIRVMRFANRVPLLYQQSACASTRAILNTSWKNYGLSQSKGALPAGPAVLLIHMSSVWVPFTSESKEAIAHYPEIIKEMKLALQDVGRKLAGFIRRTVRAREQKQKFSLFEKYIPELGSALHNLSGEKKEEIVHGLSSILKKGLPDLGGQDDQ